jgi:hypothetical protein
MKHLQQATAAEEYGYPLTITIKGNQTRNIEKE